MMGISMRGKSPLEADTRTTIDHGPSVGRGRRVRVEETFEGYINPLPRAALFYTLLEPLPALMQDPQPAS